MKTFESFYCNEIRAVGFVLLLLMAWPTDDVYAKEPSLAKINIPAPWEAVDNTALSNRVVYRVDGRLLNNKTISTALVVINRNNGRFGIAVQTSERAVRSLEVVYDSKVRLSLSLREPGVITPFCDQTSRCAPSIEIGTQFIEASDGNNGFVMFFQSGKWQQVWEHD